MPPESAATIPLYETIGVRFDLPPAYDWEARTTAAVLELAQKTTQAEDLPAACRMLANELQQYLGCGQVAVGLRRRGRGRCRVIAVSGLADLDVRGDLPRRLEALMDEAVLRAAQPTFPSVDAKLPGDSTPGRRSICIPLRSSDQRSADQTIVGAWVCLGSPEAIDSDTNLRFLEVAASAVAGTLLLLERAGGGRVRQTARRIVRAAPKVPRLVILATVAIVAAALFIPVPYDIGVQCELQPNVRRFVAAPYAGQFQKSLVKPGDIVVKGQILALMDGRELRWELAEVTAAAEHAHKSRDINLAAGKVAEAQIDQIEIQRQEIKRHLLESRLTNLEIKSPVAGIVLAGDLQRSEGAPVTIGQVLYEVALLDNMTGELAITDEEISRVSAGMPVTLRLDSHPERQWSGTLTRIHPRSVIREKDNVFLGEIPLENADGALRPGMKGRATVGTGSRSLGWVLFHRPWNYLLTWLDW